MSRKRENILILILGVVGLVFLAMMIAEAVQPAIIGDETFSMKLAEHGYGEIVSLTARDVHPPLYYFLLKAVVDVSSALSVHPVTAGKLASVLPFLLLAVVFCTKVRKQYGNMAAALSLLCVAGMPQMMKFAVEIRMYSWGMFFLVLMWLAFCDIVTEQGRRAYVAFTVFGVLAAYTHYFACLAAGYLYLALFGYFLVKERAKLKYWLGCGVITVLCYLPWLPVLRRQVSGVQEGYWIEEISLGTLVDYFQFLCNPAVYVYYSGTILGILTFLLVAAVVVWIPFLAKRKGGQKTAPIVKAGEKECEISFCILAGAGQVFFVIGMGVLFSLLVKPVLVQRYLFFCMGGALDSLCPGDFPAETGEAADRHFGIFAGGDFFKRKSLYPDRGREPGRLDAAGACSGRSGRRGRDSRKFRAGQACAELSYARDESMLLLAAEDGRPVPGAVWKSGGYKG